MYVFERLIRSALPVQRDLQEAIPVSPHLVTAGVIIQGVHQGRVTHVLRRIQTSFTFLGMKSGHNQSLHNSSARGRPCSQSGIVRYAHDYSVQRWSGPYSDTCSAS